MQSITRFSLHQKVWPTEASSHPRCLCSPRQKVSKQALQLGSACAVQVWLVQSGLQKQQDVTCSMHCT